ncbi:MAG: hypothetical protein H6926_05130 [Chromatiales bacterium]|nr:hypothetical protein [Gammaproteobacteria bacterium]MCP5352554.1 hypothetical protein [Chromatiales bacterium]
MSNRLVLHPLSARDSLPDLGPLRARLLGVGLIGDMQDDGTHLAGPRIMELITFLGCMPYLPMEPRDDGGDYAFIRLSGPYRRARLLAGRNTVRPRCPHCNGVIGDWQPIKLAWESIAEWTCPKCGEASDASEIRWRENGGVGRVLIEIGGVHPSEAVPSDELRGLLKDVSGFDWGWFYVQD